MNVLNITYIPGNHMSQVSQDQSQYQIIVAIFVHMLDLGSKNMMAIVCLQAYCSWGTHWLRGHTCKLRPSSPPWGLQTTSVLVCIP